MQNIWIELIIVLIIAFILNWTLKGVLRLLCPRIRESEKILLAPLRLFIWIIGVSYAVSILNHYISPFKGEEYFHRVRDGSIIIALTWLVLRWKRHKESRWLNEKNGHRMDPVTADALSKLLSMTILLLAAIWILQIAGLNILPLLAFGGIGAATIGFAAKDAIANFFDGILLHITRPFTPGEEILIEKEGVQGIVEQIGWCSTLIRDREKRVVFLPNAIFSRVLVVNCSRVSHRRIYEAFSIDERHSGELTGLIEEIENHVDASPLVDPKIPSIVSLEHIGGDGLELSMEIYTTKTRLDEYRKARQEILLMVVGILQQRKIISAISQTFIRTQLAAYLVSRR